MPKSLQDGESPIIPIKAPAALRERLKAVLRDGETVSGVTRELWESLIRKREKGKGKGKK